MYLYLDHVAGAGAGSHARDTKPNHDLTNPYDAARAFAWRVWLVFPCVPGGKELATPNRFYAATTNPATIVRWWRANPAYNVAIRCGAGSGLWVVDRDDDDGGAETLARLIEENWAAADASRSRRRRSQLLRDQLRSAEHNGQDRPRHRQHRSRRIRAVCSMRR